MNGRWRGRGDWRSTGGRGRGGRQWAHPASYQQKADDRAPSPPIGTLIETIKHQDLPSTAEPGQGEPKISDCDFLGSFNWMSGEGPTIAIPGKPPVWKPLSSPIQLEEDAGEYFRDQNAARSPDSPFEPAVHALLAQNATLSPPEFDLFACGSTLGSLLRFARDVDKPFRFTVEVVGRTVFFVRRENSPDEKLVDVRGYGHSFPEKYAPWEAEVEGSESHQRMISYTFAGLRCIVRFEGDGYLADEVQQPLPKDDLPPPTDTGHLSVRHAGKKVPQEAIFDLKTRSAKRQDDDILSEELPRLWITQIPHFVLAFHERGTFRDIRVNNVREEVQAWEMLNANALRKLGALVHKIVALARKSRDGKCEVRCRARGTLEIHAQLPDAPRPVSARLCERWTGKRVSPAVSEDGDASDGASASSGDGGELDKEDETAFSDEEAEKDYTACSELCGYCGRCGY
ncbi:hypothetical protein LTR36_009522 [Oleoguttula mirabilis]|uniref:Geranylgeranyl pyrophosphate synthetase n=1 Tax=Oleoguttula mirabilis TaxID=1507867 RepID=A0AAV9JSY4_9PEZI|nr:hypothetical protein LTR36_009522 [Oleoguttula mirabilis]